MKNRRTFSDLIFLLIILFLTVATFISYHRIIKLNDDSNLLAHTTLVKYKLARALTLFREAESGLQHSIQTHDKNFSIQFEKDTSLAFQKLHELDSLVHDDKDQQIRIAQLGKIVHKYFDNLKGERIKSEKLTEDIAFYSSQSITILNKIQQLIVELRHVEDDLLLEKIQEKDRSAFFTPVYSLILSLLAILIVTAAYFRIRNETNLRKRAEELVLTRSQLQEAESRSRLAIEATRMGTFDWNLKNQEFLSSPRLDEIFGGGREQGVSHQEMLARIHPDDKPLRDKAVLDSLESGSLNYVLRVIWPDKSLHWVSVYGKIFSDEVRNTSRMYGTAVDITSEKIALEDLKKSEANLETKVFERTQSLNYVNLALRQTVSELEQTNSELASFNYIASHDLQEPLRKIIAFSKRVGDLEQQRLSDTSQDYFNRIVQSAYRMQTLINAFLSYSQTSNTHVAFELTDLTLVFKEVKNEFAEVTESKNIILDSQPLPIVMGIPIQISQLFTNLIGNAIKYIRHGTDSKIEVFAEEITGKELQFEGVDQAMTFWKISIRDNGIGFDPAYENQIFELFQRLHSRQEYEGTGIGLAICKKIMRNHKGYISASGKAGSGAVFCMYFPSGMNS